MRFKLLDSRLTGVALTIGTVILVAYGLEMEIGKNCSTVANQPFYPCDELDFTLLPIVSSTPEMTWRVGSEKFSVVLADGIDTAFRSPDLSVCVSTSISSWCRNTQHFSTSLKLEAKNRQNGQEN